MLMDKSGQSSRRKVFVLLMRDLYMASKTISNKSGLIGLFGLFMGQGFLIGLVLIVLGLTKTIDPFVLISYEYGPVSYTHLTLPTILRV